MSLQHSLDASVAQASPAFRSSADPRASTAVDVSPARFDARTTARDQNDEQHTFIGGYWLLSQLAVGEFCTIHRARPIVSAGARTEVVIKRLRSAHEHGPARARLLREARVGLGLRARNLVRVLEIHDEPELFVVMEHVEGSTLSGLLARTQGFERLRYIIPMFIDTLHGLSALHNWRDEEGAPGFLVHQAPSMNHMLAGVDGLTRLIDLAHVYGRPLAAASELFSGSDPRAATGGRPFVSRSLAPEQRVAHVELDPRCDIFLLGSALRAVLARVSGASAAGSATDPRASADALAACGPLRAIAERACAVKRSARFWSADEMAYQLQKAAVDADLFAAPTAVGAWVRSVLEQPAFAPHRGKPIAQARPLVSIPPPIPVSASSRAEPRASTACTAPPAGEARAPVREQKRQAPRVVPVFASPLFARAEAASPALFGARADLGASTPRPVFASPVFANAQVANAEVANDVQASAAFASPRESGTFATVARTTLLGRVTGTAGALALLIGIVTLGVRGVQHLSTASAAHMQFAATPGMMRAAPGAAPREANAPQPIVTSLAKAPRPRFVSARVQVLNAQRAEADASASFEGEDELEVAGASSAQTIAESIRAISERKLALRSKSLFERPRQLRAELPSNPY